MAETRAKKQRRRGPGRPFEPGKSGNPTGRPRGTRHHVTILAEQLLDGEAEGLVRKAIELALDGDGAALRLCFDRIIPPRRERPAPLSLPSVVSPSDAVAAMAALLAAAAAGDVTPGEAGELSNLIANVLKAIEVTELEQRLRALEERPTPFTRTP